MSVLRVQRSGESSAPFVLPRPWKTERLVDLPERELRAWYDNMAAGRDLQQNELRLEYHLKDSKLVFNLVPKRIYLPDGSVRVVRLPDDEFLGKLKDAVTSGVTGLIEDADIVMADTGKTGRELVRDIVDAQLRVIREHGVERYGSFEHALGGLRHHAPETLSMMISSINRFGFDGEGGIHPEILGVVNFKGESAGDCFCEYHTHTGRDNVYPSQGDVLVMLRDGKASKIIGTRQEDGSFRVVEWMMRDDARVRESLSQQTRGKRDSAFGWMRGSEMREFIDETFEGREYRLGEVDGKMTFRPLPAAQ